MQPRAKMTNDDIPIDEGIPKSDTRFEPDRFRGFRSSSAISSFVIVSFAVVACLLPFVGKAYHIDDPLFVWTAQQISQHPFDFFGFDVNWYATRQPMAAVTQNPPGAS